MLKTKLNPSKTIKMLSVKAEILRLGICFHFCSSSLMRTKILSPSFLSGFVLWAVLHFSQQAVCLHHVGFRCSFLSCFWWLLCRWPGVCLTELSNNDSDRWPTFKQPNLALFSLSLCEKLKKILTLLPVKAVQVVEVWHRSFCSKRRVVQLMITCNGKWSTK